ncbi:MAG: tyrosine-protein phosphatase [Clostridia bacterium]
MSAQPHLFSKSTQTLGLESVENARQLGGYPCAGGRTVKDGLLLRSGSLAKATAADLARLKRVYHLTQVVDLRTAAEIAVRPDPALPGVTLTAIDLLAGAGASSASRAITGIYGENPLSTLTSMVQSGLPGYNFYLSMLNTPTAKVGLRAFFQVLLDNRDGATLWHCTGGKDRTGVAAMLLLSALGADRAILLSDFALTNRFNAPLIEKMCAQTRANGLDAATIDGIKVLIGVNPAFMTHLLDVLCAQYGSVPAFLTAEDGLGLTQAHIAQLREMYLR